MYGKRHHKQKQPDVQVEGVGRSWKEGVVKPSPSEWGPHTLAKYIQGLGTHGSV